MNEEEQIKRAQKGDKRAFELLLQENYELMFKMAFKYCANKQDAEDITQEACIKLARFINTYNFKSAFSSWLYRMVINCGNDFYRKSKQETSIEAKNACSSKPQAETKTYANEILRQVYDLPEKEKTALLLVLSDGYTHAQAAEIMECKESTVSWYIHEARKKLLGKNEKELGHG